MRESELQCTRYRQGSTVLFVELSVWHGHPTVLSTTQQAWPVLGRKSAWCQTFASWPNLCDPRLRLRASPTQLQRPSRVSRVSGAHVEVHGTVSRFLPRGYTQSRVPACDCTRRLLYGQASAWGCSGHSKWRSYLWSENGSAGEKSSQ